MNPFRGLFGSSARDYVTATPQTMKAYGDPRLDDPVTRQIGGGETLTRAPILRPDLETPKQDRADRWAVVGATLSDMGSAFRGGSGGSLSRVQEGFRARTQKEKTDADLAQLRGLAADLYGDDEEARLLFELDPQSFAGSIIKQRTPQYVEGTDGIYEIVGGQSRQVQRYRPEEKLTFGWRRNPQTGQLEPEPNGPADPAYIARTAGVRREAVTSRPMPRATGGGRSAGGASAPPWKQDWSR